ncbi:MAG: GAF domain-containing protein [Bacteroidia bacterium]|nr:GAF domain-containing protein [Bacteroidia bacterium]
MAEQIAVEGNTREEKYNNLLPQLKSLLAGENDPVANMGNLCAALKETFGFLWVGFYLVRGNELVLGPFQGPVACTRIQMGKGVCGTAWVKQHTLIVPDVTEFPGHIACSTRSRSEIVVPLFRQGSVIAVLDIDSEHLNDFSLTDQTHLESITQLLS